MSRHMIDGRAFETKNAKEVFDEQTWHDGHNSISHATGSQWEHETLYLSRKDQWYIVHTSQWQGSSDTARCVGYDEAAQWMFQNKYDLDDMPEGLRERAESNCE
ncbi:MAG: hypothetical protein NTZ35_00225 [Ignavibacteriales bacterium]|nr:hypothetical protein [Ignavibacteriales bacterium]